MRLLALRHLVAVLSLPPPLRCLPRRALHASSPDLAPEKNSKFDCFVVPATEIHIPQGPYIFCHSKETPLCIEGLHVQQMSWLLSTDQLLG